jgi:outer membrane receptor protein involved in Fe transport
MYQIIDSASSIKGEHTIRYGIDLRDYRFSSTNAANSRGNFNFTGAWSGNAFADFLTGYPNNASRDFPRNQFGQYQRQFHFFVQDDWKVSRSVTVNLGLRYEINRIPHWTLWQGARFDFNTGKVAVERMSNGQINLTTQQVAQFASCFGMSSRHCPGWVAKQPDATALERWAPRAGRMTVQGQDRGPRRRRS